MVYEGASKLGDFFKSRREKGVPGLPMFSVTLTNGLVPRDSLERKMETNLGDDEHLLACKGDIVYNMMRMWQGASGLAYRDGLLSPAYVVLTPEKGIDSLYASYLFKSPRLIYLFWAYSYGLTSDRLRLYYNDFRNIPVTVPTIQEQQKIAQIFSTWDKAIEKLETLIAAKQKRKKALMQQLLTGKKRFCGFEGDWEWVRLGDIAQMNSGGTPSSTISEYYDGDIPWVSIADMTKHGKFIFNTERNITTLGLENSSARIYPINTVLYAMYASIGECSIAKVELASSQAILGIKPSEHLDYLFLYFYLSSLKDKIKLQGQQGTQANLNAGMVKDFRLQLPPLAEQQKIASVFSAADTEIEAHQRQLAALKEQKKGLMQQLLTDKKRGKINKPERLPELAEA